MPECKLREPCEYTQSVFLCQKDRFQVILVLLLRRLCLTKQYNKVTANIFGQVAKHQVRVK